MIKRYTREEIGKIWSQENKYQSWLDVEIAVCEAQTSLGNMPNQALLTIKEKANFNSERIEEIELEVKHDVIAFLTCLNENIDNEASKYIHRGMTSSDMLDTALALQVKQSNQILLKDIEDVIETIKSKALLYKDTVCIGRSHGIHAEPTTFGVKLCNWLDIMNRNLDRFKSAAKEIEVGQISGPVGTYSNIAPEVEVETCKILGLKPCNVSTQVIQRDIHANYMQTLAIIASTIGQFVMEIRHLQRTEVLEVEEGFSKGQKGSSAMPHKRNPISSENINGLVRIIRSNSIAALENIELWHERDISHSSVERIIFPDSIILLDYVLNRFKNTLDNLIVHENNMKKNTNLYGGCIYSQKVMLELINKGLTREDAYKIVQENAHAAWNKENGNFKNNLYSDKRVTSVLTQVEIEECFSAQYYLRNINEIYKRLEI